MDDLKIELLLSSVGFRGSDLDDLAPPFETEYDTRIGLKWYPSATGPDTWTLILSAAGLSAALFAKKFGDLLATDLYNWAKASLKSFFAKKPHNHGVLVIVLENVRLYSNTPIEVLISGELAPLLLNADLSQGKEWDIEFDEETRQLVLKRSGEP